MSSISEAFPTYYGTVPRGTKKEFTLQEYKHDVPMDGIVFESLKQTSTCVGRIVQGEVLQGSALLISKSHILVNHAYSDGNKVQFPLLRTELPTRSYIDGSKDLPSELQIDFKILKCEDQIFKPAKLSIGNSEGTSIQIFYKQDRLSEPTLKPYTSESAGPLMQRSNKASAATTFSESGGARFDPVMGAVHSIHQGEREALKINDIYSALEYIAEHHPDLHKQEAAKDVLSSIQVVDLKYLRMESSTLPLVTGAVIPEGAQQKLNINNGPVFPDPAFTVSRRLVEDSIAAINNLEFADLWRARGGTMTIRTNGDARIDIQPTSRNSTHQNIQIQKNGLGGGGLATTYAGVLIDFKLENLVEESQQRHVVKKVKSALKSSLWGASQEQFNLKQIDLTWNI